MVIFSRRNIIAAAFVTLSATAMAQNGTAEEQAACRPDVRRFCHHLAPDAGSQIYLQCLQEHRQELSSRCRAVLENHGV